MKSSSCIHTMTVERKFNLNPHKTKRIKVGTRGNKYKNITVKEEWKTIFKVAVGGQYGGETVPRIEGKNYEDLCKKVDQYCKEYEVLLTNEELTTCTNCGGHGYIKKTERS